MSDNGDTRTIVLNVPRPWEPGTAATVTLVVVGDSLLYHGDQCKEAVKCAVTDWINTTVDGKDEWEESSEDLNVGDLSGCYSSTLKPFLKKYGILELDIQTCSRESMHSWEFDDVLKN